MKINLSDVTPFHDFLGGFWGANILKSEQSNKNIRKFPKHNLTNNFVRNLVVYSEGRKQI